MPFQINYQNFGISHARGSPFGWYSVVGVALNQFRLRNKITQLRPDLQEYSSEVREGPVYLGVLSLSTPLNCKIELAICSSARPWLVKIASSAPALPGHDWGQPIGSTFVEIEFSISEARPPKV